MKAMRCAPVVIAVLILQTIALAAESQDIRVQRPASAVPLIARGEWRTSLTPPVLAALSATVTREMQIGALRRDEMAYRRLAHALSATRGYEGLAQA